MISIIVPIHNEEKILSENSFYFKNLARQGELIFVDGASNDRSTRMARRLGKVLHAQRGRAAQMNFGARATEGDILLFLHADSVIFPNTLNNIERQIKENDFVGGCLTQRIDKNAFIYRLIEGQGNLRARITKEFYGDQGIFVRKNVFFKMGGFPEVSIMEDILFTQSLRRQGKTVVLPDKIIVSPRRWEKTGIIKTALLYNFIIFMFLIRIPLNKIKQIYGDLR